MAQGFKLNGSTGYFQNSGVDVMAFDDIYPEGHQSGVSIIMHGNRVATNGDIRFEQTPGQWQPVPKQGERELDETANTITTSLSFPDRSRHLKGFNPMIYPDFEFNYKVTVQGEGNAVKVSVDLDRPIPDHFVGKISFNLELFPGSLFGKPWIMDDKHGIFPQQPNGPVLSLPPNHVHTGDYSEPDARADFKRLTDDSGYNPLIADDLIAAPYAVGRRFTVRPDDPYNRFTVESKGAELKLYDGRMNHNNGWFVLSSEVPAGATSGAIEWIITPSVVEDWLYPAVVQTSQVGYHPTQPKVAIIELDQRESKREEVELIKITASGEQKVLSADGQEWGKFLRYHYLKFDFSSIEEEGLYKVRYGSSESSVFSIASDVYDRGVWQPVLEYFLPVQMCHMRVSEKYRVWHGLCHDDDARMAPTDFNHIDGYAQGPSTLTSYEPGDVVPGLNVGGWHDAGDFDLRVESQSGEFYTLALAYEAFGVDYDVTTIDQEQRIVEIHQPDGKNDILQQIEHGVLSVVGAYRALGRLYRGIIENDLRQYVHLGDSATITDGIKGNDDDRWVFTEDNPPRELTTAAHLAAASRTLQGFNDTLSAQALEAASELFAVTYVSGQANSNSSDVGGDGGDGGEDAGVSENKGGGDGGVSENNSGNEKRNEDVNVNEDSGGTVSEDASGGSSDGETALKIATIHAAAELYLTTNDQQYKDVLLSEMEWIVANLDKVGWFIARAEQVMNDASFTQSLRDALPALKRQYEEQSAETPYGIPYRPHIWGAGWGIQRLGFEYYFLHDAYPDIFDPELIYNALNFVLGCHPGSNTTSFASGVGATSATVGYGLNRADWSYIPGGVVSGTALIRPDFPELLEFPYLWQQVEYVMGGGSSHYMFIALAAQHMTSGK